MLISSLLRGQSIVGVAPEESVLHVARLMVERNIGAVPVVREGELVGIFSERDLMTRVIVAGKNPTHTAVAEVMTHDPLTVRPDDDLETCMTLMRRHRFRHLLVCHGRQLRGIISLRDLLLHDLNEKDDEVRMMRAYLHSTPETI
jgi:CBS domain-containing protein